MADTSRMPWNAPTMSSLRLEFVTLAQQPGTNFAQLCRRFSISRDIGYKWLKRFKEGGASSLSDQSRRPHSCPHQTPLCLQEKILELRAAHPAWGPRKLK